MKRRHIQVGLGCLFALAAVWFATTARAADADETGKPEGFPDVDLLGGSIPRYTAVVVDAWTKDVGYLMFDGNVEEGYPRVYIWVPGDMDYRRPVMKRVVGENEFSPFEFFSTGDGKQAVIEWQAKWGIRTHGSYDRLDYKTGKMVHVERETTRTPAFFYRCNYMRAKGTVRTHTTKDFTLNIGIDGEFRTSESWEDLPEAIAPWEQLRFYMIRQQTPEEKRGKVLFRGRLQFWSINQWRDIVIRAFPEDAGATLSIRPYMEPPVYSNSFGVKEAFDTGVEVELPYGWYEYNWDFKCDGVNVTPRKDFHVVLTPQPFSATVHD